MMKKNKLFALALLGSASVYGQAHLQAGSTESRMEGLKKRTALEQSSLIKNIKFRNVGPTVMSGRVVDIDVNPANSIEFYVAYATGGLWYTNNNGQSFTPVSDTLDHLFMGDIAVDWKSNTIYLGTGESNASRSTYAGTGVYKSTDGGKTWQYLGLPDSHHIGKVIISPKDPNTVWVAAIGHLYSPNKERGIFKTTDGGKTWAKTLYIDDKTGGIDLDIDPENPNNVYAAMWYRTRTPWNFEEGGPSSGIYKSTDGGTKWSLISGAGSGFPTGKAGGRIGLSVSVQNPQLIFAVLDNNDNRPSKKDTSGKYSLLEFRKATKEDFAKLDEKKLDEFLKENRFPEDINAKSLKAQVAEGKLKPTVVADYLKNGNTDMLVNEVKGAEVYKSSDGGKSWTKTHNNFIDAFSSYGYYMSEIWVSPKDSNKVVITGVPLSLSTDGGKTFKNIGGNGVHSDHHVVWFDPQNDNHMINGNDGGINITYDLGKNWIKANSASVGQFYSVAVDDARPYNVYGGLQDNGVWYGPSTNVENTAWYATGEYPYKNIGGGDGMMVQVDTRNNATYYAGSQFGMYSRSSKDRTAPSLPIHPMHKVGEVPLRYNWETPILLSRFNQDILYMGSNKFHRSLNKGETMETLSGDLTKGYKEGDVPFGTTTWIAESPLKFGLLYVGTDDGLIHLSRNGGYDWTTISDKLPQDLWVSCITPSAFKDGRVYASLNGYRFDNFSPYLFVSEDFGGTWKAINGNLPPEPINSVKEDPKNENILYVGTDGGLYMSMDKGLSYMPFGGNLPRVPVHDIAIQQRENDIVLGTHGRSIYIANLDAIQKLTPALVAKNAEVFDIKEVTASAGTGRGFGRGSARPSASIAYYVKSGGPATIRIKNTKGEVLNTFTPATEAGLNVFDYDLSIKQSNNVEAGLASTLTPGTYTVEVEAGGTTTSKPLVVKSAAARDRNGGGAPGESEENEIK
ncbi:glycosyl hydrolase [Segetibacter sp. 3557_3]|uniref:VPS10 domain-containing protein n=1 Tax=Segetibacter sp. 3557_3 TaxID=2547429 RepID=UPI00105845E0|nr:glycosyl hydrolase [Segetibacter sp. 3557_3]TDH24252.1 glycosyl hydrolase [Segetibacter sp. 3557_3]